MSERIQAIRGMNDILPEKSSMWRYIELQLSECAKRYGYQEIRFPIIENTQLFKRTVGEITDIVEKEMYTFCDLNGDSISLRPEGTAGCVRACLEHGLIHNQQQKLYYLGPMFRHERPQKGRYRQFNHFGIEAFGFAGIGIELELILICHRLWKQFGLLDSIQLQINTLGTLVERKCYKAALVNYFNEHYNLLDEDSKNRLTKNPLRILDSKNQDMQLLIAKAPKLIDYLQEESRLRFDSFCAGLEALSLPYCINPTLVRGLDYYGQVVFEWVTDKLGSQATLCAGGRYDVLVEQLGGLPTPAIGFAIGIERLMLLLDALQFKPQDKTYLSLFFIVCNEMAMTQALKLAESIRNANPAIDVMINFFGGSYKSQFKKADKSGAHLALILGEYELEKQQISIKDLRKEAKQITLEQSQVNQFLADYLV